MSQEQYEQNNSAASTVEAGATTGKAISKIAKGAATGGMHGAALAAAGESKKYLIAIVVAVLAIPILLIAMLPSIIFGSLLGDDTVDSTAITSNDVLVQNMMDINLTAEYISSRTGEATVEVEGTMRELNSMRITNYTPQFRETNSIGKRMLMTPDEVLRIKPDEELVFIRGQKVLKAHRFDYARWGF